MTDTKIWTPATFAIECGLVKPGVRPFDATVVGSHEVDGEIWAQFGIHEDDIPSVGATYRVTHLPTGRHIVTVPMRDKARQFCEEIAPLADWTTAKPGLPPSDDPDGLAAAISDASYRAREGHRLGHPICQRDHSALPAGPAPLLQGDAVELPGFESVEAAPDQRSRPWTA